MIQQHLTEAQLAILSNETTTAMQTAHQALTADTTQLASGTIAKMEQLAREHEAAFLRDLAELKDTLNLAKEYAASTDITEQQGRDYGEVPGSNKAPGFSTSHEELLGSLLHTTDTESYANAGPSESGVARDLAVASRPSANPQGWLNSASRQDKAGGKVNPPNPNDL